MINFKRDHLSFIAIQAELIEKLLNLRNEPDEYHESQGSKKDIIDTNGNAFNGISYEMDYSESKVSFKFLK